MTRTSTRLPNASSNISLTTTASRSSRKSSNGTVAQAEKPKSIGVTCRSRACALCLMVPAIKSDTQIVPRRQRSPNPLSRSRSGLSTKQVRYSHQPTVYQPPMKLENLRLKRAVVISPLTKRHESSTLPVHIRQRNPGHLQDRGSKVRHV